MENSNYTIKRRRVFLLQDLPEPLTRASFHLQLFDNYLEETRIRLRAVRNPKTKEWTRLLEQRFPATEQDLSLWNTSALVLDEKEYAAFERFEGREIRKNRYFCEHGERHLELDVFIGKLWGLTLAKAYFETSEEKEGFETPGFSALEVTNNSFFIDENLLDKTFEDVRREFQKQTSK